MFFKPRVIMWSRTLFNLSLHSNACTSFEFSSTYSLENMLLPFNLIKKNKNIKYISTSFHNFNQNNFLKDEV